MRNFTLLFTFLMTLTGFSQTSVTVDASAAQVGFANVFETDGTTYVFGSDWGVADVKTVLDPIANTITLQPNFNNYADAEGDTDAELFWRNNGGAGPLGNKIFEGNTFVALPDFAENDLTFTGTVISNTLTTPYDPTDPLSYSVMGFIKGLDASFNQVVIQQVELTAGQEFTINATGLQGLLVQYGFFVYGLNANPLDEATLGSVVVGPSTLSTNDISTIDFNVYPNPAIDNWTIKSSEAISGVEVFDILGKSVANFEVNSTSFQIPASNLNSGLYFAKVNTANASTSIRIIKK